MKELFEFIWNMPMHQVVLIIAVLAVFVILIFLAFMRGIGKGLRKRRQRFDEMNNDFDEMKQRFRSR